MIKEYLAVIITASLIVGIPIFFSLIYFGIKFCNKNNTLGILLLVIPLNIIGLILGICLLYNYRHKSSTSNKKYIDKLEEKIKKNKK